MAESSAQTKVGTKADYLALSTAARMGESWARMKAAMMVGSLADY
jgi:hypothetical protein